MLSRMFTTLLLVTAGAAIGCGSTEKNAGMERDPFVMSHLTHQKEDPLFAASESNESFESEDLSMQSDSESVSRKPDTALAQPAIAQTPFQMTSYTENDEDLEQRYRWLDGRLEQHNGRDPGWYIRYLPSGQPDRFDGLLRLASDDRLGLFREGDRVRIQGEVFRNGPGDYRYRVESISMLDE